MSSLLSSNQETTVRQLWHALHGAARVLIGTHEHPDGDALGSSLALWAALRPLDKEVTVYIPDAAPPFFRFLPHFSELTTTKPDVSRYDAILLVDYTQLYRTHLEEEFKQHRLSICIDHHYDNPGGGTYTVVVAQAAATAQIIYEIYKLVGAPITAEIATCLLTGIFTDTGSFMHDSTTPEILNIAAELMSKGARLSHIAHETYQKKDLPSLRIWGRALSRILISEKTGAAVSIVTPEDLKECEATLDDLSGVVSMLNTLPQAKFAMVLCEYTPGIIKGSLRSEPHKNVDVSLLAKRLGGGGHKLASGFEIKGHLVQKDDRWRIEPV